MSKAEKWFMEIRPFTEDENDPGFRRLAANSERDAERMSRGATVGEIVADLRRRAQSCEDTGTHPKVMARAERRAWWLAADKLRRAANDYERAGAPDAP